MLIYSTLAHKGLNNF